MPTEEKEQWMIGEWVCRGKTAQHRGCQNDRGCVTMERIGESEERENGESEKHERGKMSETMEKRQDNAMES